MQILQQAADFYIHSSRYLYKRRYRHAGGIDAPFNARQIRDAQAGLFGQLCLGQMLQPAVKNYSRTYFLIDFCKIQINCILSLEPQSFIPRDEPLVIHIERSGYQQYGFHIVRPFAAFYIRYAGTGYVRLARQLYLRPSPQAAVIENFCTYSLVFCRKLIFTHDNTSS